MKFVFILAALAAVAAAQPQDCNGAIEGPVVDPPVEMGCIDNSCGSQCSLDSMPLDDEVDVYWCECDPAGEPGCCHTIQKKASGNWQTPYGWGTCLGTECPGGTCGGSVSAGFACTG
jgi:hypothetical protein